MEVFGLMRLIWRHFSKEGKPKPKSEEEAGEIQWKKNYATTGLNTNSGVKIGGWRRRQRGIGARCGGQGGQWRGKTHRPGSHLSVAYKRLREGSKFYSVEQNHECLHTSTEIPNFLAKTLNYVA